MYKSVYNIYLEIDVQPPLKQTMGQPQREDSHLEIDFDEFNESFGERITALKNVIRPMHRYKIEKAMKTTVATVTTTGFYVGQLGYILASSMILIMMPLAFEQQKDSELKNQIPDSADSKELLENFDQ